LAIKVYSWVGTFALWNGDLQGLLKLMDFGENKIASHPYPKMVEHGISDDALFRSLTIIIDIIQVHIL
jgi:hypothetical protein